MQLKADVTHASATTGSIDFAGEYTSAVERILAQWSAPEVSVAVEVFRKNNLHLKWGDFPVKSHELAEYRRLAPTIKDPVLLKAAVLAREIRELPGGIDKLLRTDAVLYCDQTLAGIIGDLPAHIKSALSSPLSLFNVLVTEVSETLSANGIYSLLPVEERSILLRISSMVMRASRAKGEHKKISVKDLLNSAIIFEIGEPKLIEDYELEQLPFYIKVGLAEQDFNRLKGGDIIAGSFRGASSGQNKFEGLIIYNTSLPQTRNTLVHEGDHAAFFQIGKGFVRLQETGAFSATPAHQARKVLQSSKEEALAFSDTARNELIAYRSSDTCVAMGALGVRHYIDELKKLKHEIRENIKVKLEFQDKLFSCCVSDFVKYAKDSLEYMWIIDYLTNNLDSKQTGILNSILRLTPTEDRWSATEHFGFSAADLQALRLAELKQYQNVRFVDRLPFRRKHDELRVSCLFPEAVLKHQIKILTDGGADSLQRKFAWEQLIIGAVLAVHENTVPAEDMMKFLNHNKKYIVAHERSRDESKFSRGVQFKDLLFMLAPSFQRLNIDELEQIANGAIEDPMFSPIRSNILIQIMQSGLPDNLVAPDSPLRTEAGCTRIWKFFENMYR
jgi:hypothetical protein